MLRPVQLVLPAYYAASASGPFPTHVADADQETDASSVAQIADARGSDLRDRCGNGGDGGAALVHVRLTKAVSTVVPSLLSKTSVVHYRRPAQSLGKRAMTSLRLALAGVVVFGAAAGAQTVLRLPASTRALGMGNVGVVGRDDDVLFYNPAQLVVARGMTLSGEHASETPVTTGAVSSAIAFGSGGVGIGGLFSRIEVAPTPLVPRIVPVTSIVGTAAAAQVIKGIRLGVAGKYLGENTDSEYRSRTMVDAGLARTFMQYFTGGLSVQNIGIVGKDLSGPLPTRATLGASGVGPVGPYDVVLTTAISMDDRDHRVRPAAGAEASWSWLNGYAVAVRTGVRDPVAGEKAFTLGAGLTVDRLSLDYALETLGGLDGSHAGHRIGLRIR